MLSQSKLHLHRQLHVGKVGERERRVLKLGVGSLRGGLEVGIHVRSRGLFNPTCRARATDAAAHNPPPPPGLSYLGARPPALRPPPPPPPPRPHPRGGWRSDFPPPHSPA